METINWNEEILNEMLTTPSERLIADVAQIRGDIMVLGPAAKWARTSIVKSIRELCAYAKEYSKGKIGGL